MRQKEKKREREKPASGQECLAVHLSGGFTTKLFAGQVGVVRRVDVVVVEVVVHLLVDLQIFQPHGRVVVRHQVVDESFLAQTTCWENSERQK